MFELEFVKLELLYNHNLYFKLPQRVQIAYNWNPTLGMFRLKGAYIYKVIN